jgi:FADH2 O2-dependent halogenase
VDLHFLEQARAAGAEYVDRVALEEFDAGGTAVRLSGRRGAERVSVEARRVADASGPRGFLHRRLGLGEKEFPGLPKASALYAHFRGVAPMEEVSPLADDPPYPPDDAALHHVFDGGWIWVLRFSEGIVSAGAMLSPELAREVRAEEGEPAWRRLIAMFPAIQRQFRRAEPLFPFRYSAKAAFRTDAASGPGWWMLPSAAAFVDPLLSTGIPLTLLGVARAGEALEETDDAGLGARLAALGERTLDEVDAAAALVAALWKRFDDFPAFCAATMLYFASASFGEASCRLGRDALPGFLGSDRPSLRGAISRSLDGAGNAPGFADRIRRAIEPWNVAGLMDPSRRNWYPVVAADLRAAADKLGASSVEIERLLARSGFGGGIILPE